MGWRAISTYKNPPCGGCEERYEACHTECGRYIQWKEEARKVREKIRQERMIDQYKKKRVYQIEIEKWKNKTHR